MAVGNLLWLHTKSEFLEIFKSSLCFILEHLRIFLNLIGKILESIWHYKKNENMTGVFD